MEAAREMTLDEWVDRLPESHVARRELTALRSQLAAANEAVMVLESLVRTGGRVSFVKESPHQYQHPSGISVLFTDSQGRLHSYTKPTLAEAIAEALARASVEKAGKQ